LPRISAPASSGEDWLDSYLTAPIWRFLLSSGVCGQMPMLGVMMPSVDRVGRYFPLTVVVELPASVPPMALTIHGRQWRVTVVRE